MEKVEVKKENKPTGYIPVKRSKFLEDGKSLAIAARWNTPGPDVYNLPSTIGHKSFDSRLKKTPAYTISGKLNVNMNTTGSPGPIYNPTFKLDSNAPAYTLKGKRRESSSNKFPGPGEYEPEKHMDLTHSRSISCMIFGRRRTERVSDENLSGNMYDVSIRFGKKSFTTKCTNSPGFKFVSRGEMENIKSVTSSIKTEYHPDFDYVRKSGPQWSISGRNFPPNMKKASPAPNQYKPEIATTRFKNAPKITMGVKYSDYCSTGYFPSGDENQI